MPASSSRLLLLIAVSVAGAALTGCSGDSSTSEETTTKSGNTVAIQGFKFVPATITVKAGTVVTWTNADAAEHTATADDKSFDSELFGKGKSYSYTFTKPGTFTYHCTPHGYMKGTVIVT